MKYAYKYHNPRRFVTAATALTVVAIAGIMSVSGIVNAASNRAHFADPIIQRIHESSKKAQTSTQPTTTVTPTTPATTTPSQPTTVSKPATAPVVTNQPQAPVVPPDTAAASKVTTTAQADTASIMKPVTYTSNQLSTTNRDQLVLVASALAIVGVCLYAATFIRRKPSALAPAPIRTIPVEVVAR